MKKQYILIGVVILVALLALAGYSYNSGIKDPDLIDNLAVDISTEIVNKRLVSNNYQTLGQFDEESLSQIDFVNMVSPGQIDIEIGDEPLLEVFEGGEFLQIDSSTVQLSIAAGVKDGNYYQDKPYHIRLVVPELTGVVMNPISGNSGEINIGTLVGDQLSLAMTTDGQINAPELTVESLGVSVFGKGDINVRGTVTTLNVYNEGSGNINGGSLFSDIANIDLISTGNIELGRIGVENANVTGTGLYSFLE